MADWYNIIVGVKEIESAITEMPVSEVSEIMTWLAEHHAQLWDAQIESDLAAGRLDKLLAEVNKEYGAGLAKPL